MNKSNEEKIEILTKRLHEIECELLRIRQLRPMISTGDGWSKCVSFDLMSEYAIKWMKQEEIF